MARGWGTVRGGFRWEGGARLEAEVNHALDDKEAPGAAAHQEPLRGQATGSWDREPHIWIQFGSDCVVVAQNNGFLVFRGRKVEWQF